MTTKYASASGATNLCKRFKCLTKAHFCHIITKSTLRGIPMSNHSEIIPQNPPPTEDETPTIQHHEIASKIGEQLRSARMQKNINLDIIADELKIRTHHLENFENGNYHELPETTYALGFIKSYAQYLNMPTDDILTEFRTILNSRENNDKNIIGIQEAPVSRTSLYYVFFAAAILCVVLYIVWINYSESGSFSWFNEQLSQFITNLKPKAYS